VTQTYRASPHTFELILSRRLISVWYSIRTRFQLKVPVASNSRCERHGSREWRRRTVMAPVQPAAAIHSPQVAVDARWLQGEYVKPLLSKLGSIFAFTLNLFSPTWAASASDVLPVGLMISGKPTDAPVANLAFAAGADVIAAQDFVGAITVAQTPMQTKPAIERPVQDGRDARLFPGVTLEFFTMDGLLVPVQRGEMVRESAPVKVPSFWQVIPQVGRVWKEGSDGKWS